MALARCGEGSVAEDAIQNLSERCPDAVASEFQRFVRARRGSTELGLQMYERHLQWRQGRGSLESLAEASRAVPQKFVRPCGQAKDGSPMILVQGARYDLSVPADQYVLACADALDATVSRDDDRKVTVLVDLRPGEGWPNPPGQQLLSFIRLLCSELSVNYPERAQRVIVYPMPSLVKHLWWVVRGLLDSSTREKVVILSGPGGQDCPPELGEYVSRSELPIDTHCRHGNLDH